MVVMRDVLTEEYFGGPERRYVCDGGLHAFQVDW